MQTEVELLSKSKVNLETAKLNWTELQIFFAKGLLIVVSDKLDLVEVAYQMSIDNKTQVEHWLNSGLLAQVSDQQAKEWLARQCWLWTVVVKPWILVQVIEQEQDNI